MVQIRISYDADNWKNKALRCLEAGAILKAVPEARMKTLVAACEDRGLHVRVEEGNESYRMIPRSAESEARDTS